MILLSYIVTVYNKLSYLDRCLKSLLNNKTTDEYEIIVVDDGSTDGSEVICDEYAKKDSRIRIIHKANAGVSAARNTGITAAKGEWITILDGDDYIRTNSLAELKKAIGKYENKAELIYFNGYGDINGQILKNQFFLKEDVDYTDRKDEIIESAVSIGLMPSGYKHYFSLGAPVCKIIKRSVLIENHIIFDEDVKFAEDTLFSIRLISCSRGIYYHDTYLYYYCLNSESATHKYRPFLSGEMDIFFKKLKDSINFKSIRVKRAYYLRAFVESQRCIRNQFYNKKNPKTLKERKKETNEFMSQKPYKKAVQIYRKDKSFMNRLKAFFLHHRLYWLYSKIYSIIK